MIDTELNVEVYGVSVSCTNWEYVLSVMERVIKARNSHEYISITNTESMYHARHIPEHLEYIKGARFSLCDGIGSVIASYAFGHSVPRLNGPILMLKACEYGEKRGWRHFFYGGNEGVADLMAEKLTEKFPGLITAGTYFPPFRPLTQEEDKEVVDLINEARPDIVWVGLGLLKQEQWIADHLNKIDVPWMVGVGGAFDYHSGAIAWAPKWIQAIGMEWLFRLILQPRQRFKRYYWSYVFMFEAIGCGFVHRLKKKIRQTNV